MSVGSGFPVCPVLLEKSRISRTAAITAEHRPQLAQIRCSQRGDLTLQSAFGLGRFGPGPWILVSCGEIIGM